MADIHSSNIVWQKDENYEGSECEGVLSAVDNRHI
mgnify:CR=1 FL=1